MLLKLSLLVFLLATVVYFILPAFGNILDVTAILQDTTVKGAFLMGVFYFLKDWVNTSLSFIWTVTLGSWLVSSLNITNDADNKSQFDKVAYWLSSTYPDRLPNKKASCDYGELATYDPVMSHQQPDINFNPGDGVYLITFKGYYVTLNITSVQLHHGIGYENKPQSVVSLVFTTLGWNDHILKDIIAESTRCWERRKNDHMTMVKLANSWGGNGLPLTKVPIVNSLGDIILDKPVHSKIMQILDNFKNVEIWNKNNLMHRESILLIGPPGNGKTKLISFIAGYLNYEIYIINLATGDMNDDNLLEIFAKANPRSLIALEEIDSAIPSRDVTRERRNGQKSVTMSGLLQALDGPVNKNGPIVVATTNRYEELDRALIRPGRFNHHILLDWSNAYQQEKIISHYYPKFSTSQIKEVVDFNKGKHISCAQLVGCLKLSKNSNSSDDEVMCCIKDLKSATDVAGDRVNLDSPVRELLQQVNLKSEIISFVENELNICTIKQFKYLDSSDLISDIEKKVIYNIPKKDALVLKDFEKKAEKLTSCDQPRVNFCNKNIQDLFEMFKVPESLVKKFPKDITIGELKYFVEVIDEEGEEESEEKNENEENEENIKKNNKILEKVAIKRLNEYFEKIVDSSGDFFSLSDSLFDVLQRMGLSKNTQIELEKLGVSTINQFMLYTVSDMITEFQKPLISLTARDKSVISQAKTIVDEKIDEIQLY